jgi:membrane associated rhomboid family serine protease
MLLSEIKSGRSAFGTMLFAVMTLWAILALSYFLPINRLGIMPREPSSLPFIFTAPLLHAGISHLIANTLSLLILGTILLSVEGRRSTFIILNIVVWGGLGTWLIGRPGAVHIGASGVIFGMMGFLIFMGFFRRNLKTIFISLIVLLLYGTSALFGILPTQEGISWESHLCGLITGIVLARIYSRIDRKRGAGGFIQG